MKKCPFCAEEIQDEAIKCKHCGEMLTTAARKDVIEKNTSSPQPPQRSATQPPVLKTPPTSEAVTGETLKLFGDTRIGIWCILAWIGAAIFVSALAANYSAIQGLPVALWGVLCLIAALRGMARKATATVLSNRNCQFHSFALDVYVPAIWGTLWRSAIPVTAIAVFSAIAADGPNAKARAIEVVIGFSIISFPFVLDRPLWFRSRIRSLATIHQKKPAISSLNETGVGSVSSAAATPAIASSFPKARPSRSRNKLKVGFALIFAVVAVGAAFATLLKLSRTYTDPAAQCELGISSYKSGDYASALKWLRQAADQGNAKAQYNLACMLEKGVGISQDEVEARKWMEQSAKQGYANAQAVLGLAYLKGQFGLLKDESEAVKWLGTAATNKCSAAQFHLARCYLRGDGVPQDNVKAYSWFSIALQSADLDENDKPEALFFRDEIKSHLSPVDLDAANSFIAFMQH